MKITMIEGTAKKRKSASSVLLHGLREYLPGVEVAEYALKHAQISREAKEAILGADVLILAVPLYVDAIPSHMISVLEELEQNLALLPEKPVVYGVMNCGFYEGEHCEIAAEMLQHWCAHCGAVFGGSVAVGAGGALTALEKIPMGVGAKSTLGKTLKTFAQNILKRETAEPVFISLDLTWDEYKQIGETGWRKACRKRGVPEEALSSPCPAP